MWQKVQISVLIILSLTAQLSYQSGDAVQGCGPINPCENGGNCDASVCQCVQGFTGDFCNHKVLFSFSGPLEYNEDVSSISISVTRPTGGFVLVLTAAISGSAMVGIDYSALPQTITFQQADTVVNLPVTIIDDNDPEGDETIAITLTAEDGTSAEATVTIKANDLTVTVPDQLGGSEGSGTINIEITSQAVDSDVTVQVNTQSDGTASAGIDFTALTNHDVTFSAGSSTASFTVDIIDNGDKDGDRRFTFTISGDAITTSGPHTVVVLDDDGGRPFDCRRHTTGCAEQADICGSLPMCTCVGSPAREGDMCNIITAQKNGVPCTTNNVDCNGNGVCLGDGGTTSCACYPRYYGDNCEHDRMAAVCLRDSMIFIANPHQDFGGSIHVQGKSADNLCVATQVNNPADPNDNIDDALLGYAVNVPHNSDPCGAITPEEFVEDETEFIRYKRVFFVQYQTSPNVATGLDQRVTVICKFEKNNLVVNAGVVTLDPEKQFTEESTSNTFSPLTFEVMSSAGAVAESTTIIISTELCVTLRIPEGFAGLEILHVEFNNTLPDAPEKWKIYDAGCLHKNYRIISFKGPSYPEGNKRVMKFCFSAFTFLKSVKLTVEVKVKICLDASNCQLRPCASVSRRKRQTDSSREETFGRTFTLSTRSDETSGNTSGEADGSEVKKDAVCNLPFEFIPTVVALAAVIFFLVLLCLYLTYRLVRKTAQKAQKPKESVYFKR